MKLVIDRIHCDTDKAIPLYTHERTTREELNPRVYLLKKELPYHVRFNKNFWFSQVTVEKYIDDNLVKTYSWLQSVTPEEKEEFLKINNTPMKEEPELTPAEKNRKDYYKKYYEEHKEELKARYSSPEYKEKKKKYREEHKEEYNARSRAYYYRHREEKLMKMKEYQKKINN